MGRIHPEKGVHLLVEAFGHVVLRAPGARLRIIGPSAAAQGGGGPEYLRTLQEAATGLPVEFVGPVSDEGELSRYYREANCFCYPSLAERGEAFGRAVLEAMATGLPCVVSELECFSDFLVSGVEGVVFDHRAATAAVALADALCSVVLEPGRAVELGMRARTRAEQYSVDRVGAEYLRLFGRVVGVNADVVS